MVTMKVASGNDWLHLAKSCVPAGIKRAVKAVWRGHTLSRTLADIRKLRPGEMPSRPLLARLRVAWGNEGWSGQVDYLDEVVRRAATTTGPILECGSGLTTILLGLLAGRRGIEVWSLEDSKEWHDHVSRVVSRHQIAGVRACLSPLREYGDFTWYAVPPGMPQEFALVVCDGPGVSYQSRYGLLPVLGQRLRAGAAILVDDSSHMADIVESWLASMPVELMTRGSQVSVLRIVRKDDSRQP